MGTGATPIERAQVWATAVAGTFLAVLIAAQADVDWAWWQWLVVATLAVDLIGGPVANALGSAKLLYHRPLPTEASPLQRLAHNPVAFTAIHVQPFVAAALLPDDRWAWAATTYASALAGVLCVRAAPLYLARPIAFSVTVTSVLLQQLVAAPLGLGWLGPILVVKLVLAHALPEPAYRPESSVLQPGPDHSSDT
jgi:hypothetical protein